MGGGDVYTQIPNQWIRPTSCPDSAQDEATDQRTPTLNPPRQLEEEEFFFFPQSFLFACRNRAFVAHTLLNAPAV